MENDTFEAFIDPSLIDTTISPSASSELSNTSQFSTENMSYWLDDPNMLYSNIMSETTMSDIQNTQSSIDPSLLACLDNPDNISALLSNFFPNMASENSHMSFSEEPITTNNTKTLKPNVSWSAEANKKPFDMDVDTEKPKKVLKDTSPSNKSYSYTSKFSPSSSPSPSSGFHMTADTAAALVDEELEGIDLKSLSSKERRQLRNKISARNFRVRRKEYIVSLEGQVKQYQDENNYINTELIKVKSENRSLREEIAILKRQLGAMSLANKPSLRGSTSRATGINTPTSNSLEASRPGSPVVRFRPNKDIPTNGTSSKNSNAQWSSKNSVITVQTVLLPQSPHILTSTNLDQLLGFAPNHIPSCGSIVVFYSALAELIYSQFVRESAFVAPTPRSPMIAVFA